MGAPSTRSLRSVASGAFPQVSPCRAGCGRRSYRTLQPGCPQASLAEDSASFAFGGGQNRGGGLGVVGHQNRDRGAGIVLAGERKFLTPIDPTQAPATIKLNPDKSGRLRLRVSPVAGCWCLIPACHVVLLRAGCAGGSDIGVKVQLLQCMENSIEGQLGVERKSEANSPEPMRLQDRISRWNGPSAACLIAIQC